MNGSQRALLFAGPEASHHERAKRPANRERGQGLPLPFEREQQRRQSAGDKDQRAQRHVLKIESHDVSAAIGRAAVWDCN